MPNIKAAIKKVLAEKKRDARDSMGDVTNALGTMTSGLPGVSQMATEGNLPQAIQRFAETPTKTDVPSYNIPLKGAAVAGDAVVNALKSLVFGDVSDNRQIAKLVEKSKEGTLTPEEEKLIGSRALDSLAQSASMTGTVAPVTGAKLNTLIDMLRSGEATYDVRSGMVKKISAGNMFNLGRISKKTASEILN